MAEYDWSYRKNIALAAMLTTAAGGVNATGYFAFSTLVTNVTGHFASVAHDAIEGDNVASLQDLIWIGAFFLGAFASTALMLPLRRRGYTFVYAPAIVCEILVLLVTWRFGPGVLDNGGVSSIYLTGGLLFAMGLQNATFTAISGAVIRTTHLTGILTDLGIGASRLLFEKLGSERKALTYRFLLHLTIAGTFTLGAFGGGYLYDQVAFSALFLPIALLVLAFLYDAYYHRAEKRPGWGLPPLKE